MTESNLKPRMDERDEPEFQRNITSGTTIQSKMVKDFVKLHQKFVEEYSLCPLKMLDVKIVSNDKINRGIHIDTMDADILVQIKDNEPYWKRVEMEAVVKPDRHNAHFKKTGIVNCIKGGVPILHWQLGVIPQKFFILSVPYLRKLHAINGYQCISKMYSGKSVYKFDTLFPYPEVQYVNWPDLQSLDNYKQLLKYMMETG